MNTNDFDSMQSEAIRFAQEMRQKAEQSNSPPVHNFETPFCRGACPVKNLLGTGKHGGGDGDIILLMALMLVLTNDGGDKMLLMALLYIMT